MNRVTFLVAASLMASIATAEQPLISGPQPGTSVGYLDFSAVKCGGPKNRFKGGSNYRYY
jgi:hypothetical protein